MKVEGTGTAEEELSDVSILEEAKFLNSEDALLMSMDKKPDLKRGELLPNTITAITQHRSFMILDGRTFRRQ